jgi:alpha-glucosidase (family GH31 glycosyl hydrolase)
VERWPRQWARTRKKQKYVPFRITDRRFVDNYFKVLHHPLEKQGIDFWWLDWKQEDHTEVPGVNPTFWLNYLHFTDQEREGKRPMLFHRWGGLGNHRYEIGFSGDVVTGWDSLAFQPTFTAQAANVGYAYWSHDIGGYIPGKVDPSSTRDGFSLAPSARSSVPTRRRTPTRSVGCGPIPSRTPM